MTAGVNEFYLNTPLDRPEDSSIAVNMIPEELMKEYQGDTFVEDAYIYLKTNKLTYGLTQAGRISNKLLQKILATYGFSPTSRKPGLWMHETIPIQLALVVVDFGVENEQKEDS